MFSSKIFTNIESLKGCNIHSPTPPSEKTQEFCIASPIVNELLALKVLPLGLETAFKNAYSVAPFKCDE